MVLVKSPPSRIAFYCDTPAAAGGETSILVSGAVAARVAQERPDFAARLAREGLLYRRVLSEEDDPASAQGRGWKSTYALTRDAAEAAMLATGVHSWTWLPDGSLRTETAALPAFLDDPRSGERVFHNALAAIYLGWNDARNRGPDSVLFGSGAQLEEADVRAVAAIMDELAVNIPWQRGDLMLLDNRRAMHARRPFTPPRRVLAYLCE